MATTPLFNTPDGLDTDTSLTIVTSVRDQILTGVLDSDIVDVQVKVNDDAFVSSPSLVSFDQDSFTVPNPSVFPEGLRLGFGINTIQVRVVDVTGSVSAAATATIEVKREREIDLVAPAPTGLRVRRRNNAVEVVWAQTDAANVTGYNIYAAIDSGGGTQGYVKLNPSLITSSAFNETEFVEASEDTTFYTSQGGQLRVLLVEEDFNDVPVQTVAENVIDTANVVFDEARVTTTVESVETTTYFSFVHNRTSTTGVINNEFFADVPDDEPLFYVITTVVFDPATNRQIESTYSSELVGLPLVITTTLDEMPTKAQNDIVRDYIDSILRSDNEISAIPGSTVRDIFIEPFASEAERITFIAGFIRRSQSFSTLLAIDDLDGDDVSDPVQDNPYKLALKSALGLENDADVQSLIDDSFEKLAQNSQVTRGGQEFAVGQAVFFTTTEPTADLVVEEGTLLSTSGDSDNPPVRFQTTSRTTLPFTQRDSFFDLQKQRWEVIANIRATEPGEASNVTSGQIENVLGGTTSLQVTNKEATRFGRDEESNARLAERGILAFSGVDSGTEAGYLATALRQQGVFRAKIIKSASEFMMRDYDPVRMKHIGGKVDVWLQGLEEVQVTDTFALRFQIATNIQFVLDSNPSDLIFVAEDPRLSSDNPITELLGATAQQQSQGFGFRNVTTGQDFDLTNYSLLDYNRIQLDTSIPQPAVNTNDIVVGDYRFQDTSQYVFSRQPVFDVETVASVNTGTVLTAGANFNLFRTQDPLLEGFSTIAQDYIEITQASGVPSGDTFIVNDEPHVLVGETPDPLENLGVNPISVRVFSQDRLVEYNGPNTPSPDFLVEEGNETTALTIIRVPAGNIGNGEQVSVDYEHDENFTVDYTINNLLDRVQAAINVQSHVTADVLVKQALSNEVDLEITVVLQSGASKAQVDANLQTNLSQLLNSKPIGEPVYQSDIVQAIENTAGVAYVIVPFARMGLSDGSIIVREDINNDATFLDQQGNEKVYIFKDDLNFPTDNTGGPSNLHRGVFQDDQALTLVSKYDDLFDAVGNALIVGNDGLSIAGYSDDTTLTGQGFDTPAERQEQREALTANRVFVSVDDSDTPENHTYSATYTAQDDTGSKSLIVSDVAFLELGNLTITYRQ